MFATLVLAAVCATAGHSATELLQNGTFSNQLHPWKTNPAHGEWNPLASVPGEVNLHPDRAGQRGDVVYQNLNVTGIAGVSVSAVVELRKNFGPAGRGIAVYLEYLDNSDAQHRVPLLNPDNAAIGSTLTTFSNSFTFPAEAVRLVKFSAAKEGDGNFYGDNFSLMGSGLTMNPVTTISHLDPNCGPYGTVVSINGSAFGTTPGSVRFGGANGTVQSWSDTNITARIDAPAATGRVTVFDANQVENHGVPPFHVVSPYVTGYPVRAHQRVVKGEIAEFLVSIEFRNGFMSASGISLSVPQLGGGATFSPGPLKESGGGVVSIPTAGMNPGLHQWMVRASDGIHPPLDFPISLEVVTITNIMFTTRDPDTFATVPLPNPFTATNQGNLVIGAAFTDHTGGEIGDFETTFEAVSSNPGAVVIYRDNFGSLNVAAVGDGTSILTYTTPDGTSSNLTVNVAYPTANAVTSATLGVASMDNAGMMINTFNATANVVLTSAGRPLGISNLTSSFFNGNQSYSSEFIVLPGAVPGIYPFTAETAEARTVALLTVTNAGTRGEMRGDIHTLNDSFFHGPVGWLNFYDAGSGSLVFSNMLELGFTGSSYFRSYLPPGDYKVQLAVDPFLPFQSEQWYPNAATMAGAQTVTITAGTVTPDIDFFLNGPIQTSLPEALEFCPPDLFSSGNNDVMWFGQLVRSHDGQDAAQSPALGHQQFSFMEATVEGPGTLSFWWKVSSETNADILSFEMNFNTISNISGEVDWTLVNVPVPAGATTLSWTYQKDAANAAGMDTAWVDQVMFNGAVATAPMITQHPQNQTVNAGGNAMFNVVATGGGLTYQWQKDGSDLPDRTGLSLTLNNVQPGAAGAYRVVVTNTQGSVTSDPANLVVNVPPVIDTHPMSQTLALDGNTMLTVVASGSGPFTYQWKRNGTNLVGSTGATLNLPQLTPEYAGQYTVMVTGPGGSVTSQAATLTLIDLHMYAGITIFGKVGDQYRIEHANDLNSQNWTLTETITVPAAPYRWFDLDSPNHPMRYYRAIIQP